MAEFSSIDWRRLLTEGVVIVASILLAFSIDAWWEERQVRSELRDAMVAVLDDLRQSKDLIGQARNQVTAQQKSIEMLLEIAYDQSRTPGEFDVDSLLRNINWWIGYVPLKTSALESIVSSGNLALVRNNELRRAITDWSGSYDLLDTAISEEVEYNRGMFWPYVQKNTNWAQIDSVHDQIPGVPGGEYPDFPLSPSDSVNHSPLLADKEFQNILFYGWEIKADLVLALGWSEEWIGTTIKLLEEELRP